MSEIWSQYGNFLLIGAFIFFMFRMHGRGGGCCGGGQGTERNKEEGHQASNKEDQTSCH